MHLTLAFTRTLFMLLSVFFLTTYMISGPEGYSAANLVAGIVLGLAVGAALIGFDRLFKRFNLRAFNTATLGLFCGYLMGQALVMTFSQVLQICAASFRLNPQNFEIVSILIFLFGLYLGTLMALRAADEFYVSIPFVKFTMQAHKKKDLLLDPSILSDARIIDIAGSGLFDQYLILPRFLTKDLYAQAEANDEAIRNKAKRALDVLRKLEAVSGLELRYNETDFSDVKDPMSKTVRLARLIDANILTADISRLQMASLEGVKIINIHALSNALKPLMQAGEQMRIKIQRYGKEPRQGVGYLEDGTMVVVNGGGQYIGETIDVQVLSVKHTSSGRMIFCNALDETGHYSHAAHYQEDSEEQ